MKKLLNIVILVFIVSISVQASNSSGALSNQTINKKSSQTEKVDVIEVVVNSQTNDTPLIIEQITHISNDFDKLLPKFLKTSVLSIEIWKPLFFILMFLLGFSLKKFSDFIFRHEISNTLKKMKLSFLGSFMQCASKPFGFLIWMLFVGFAIVFLIYDPNNIVWTCCKFCLHLIFGYLFLWWAYSFVDTLTGFFLDYAKTTATTLDDHFALLLKKILKVTFSVFYTLWLISTLGFNISAFLAGLGIGGLAVALALQDTLANLFGSVIILLDRPFKIGDRIIVDSVDGFVEELGFRCTRIRTLDKTLVSIPNKTVAIEKINNVTSRKTIKVTQTIGLTYSSTPEQIETACEEIKKILTDSAKIDTPSIIVSFSEFGASSLDILILYCSKTTDYAEFVTIKQEINVKIMKKIIELGLSFAFPSQSIYLEK